MDDYTIQGPSALSRERFAAILREAGSPAAPEAASMWQALVNADVRAEVLLAFFWVESKLGAAGVAKDFDTKNPGNVRSPERATLTNTIVQTPRGPFAKYRTWADGAIDWAARMKGPKYAGAGLDSVREVLPKYAPSSDSNDPDAYARTVLAKIAEWTKGAPPVAVSKPPMDTTHPSENRGGYAGTRRVDAVVWHVTAGGFAGSLGWLTNPSSGASANYILDKGGAIYELVPPTEDAWANGQVAKPDLANPLITKWLGEKANFNQRTVSIEVARETSANERPGGFTEAQHRALVNLTAWLCSHFNLPPDRTHIIRHAQIDSVNRAHCPGLAESEMTAWIGEIAALVGGGAREGEMDRFPAESITATSNSRGEAILVINYGGQIVANEGINLQDAGAAWKNAAGEVYDRSVKDNVFEPWAKRG